MFRDPRMPEVDHDRDMPAIVKMAREISCNDNGSLDPENPDQRGVAIITPGGMIMPIPSLAPGTAPRDMVAEIEHLLPDPGPLDITVISYSNIVMEEALDASTINECIPFLGYLLGMAYLDHNVIVFEGHSSALAEACRDADLLLVDGGMVPHLQSDWMEVAKARMSEPEILVFNRDGSIQRYDPEE